MTNKFKTAAENYITKPMQERAHQEQESVQVEPKKDGRVKRKRTNEQRLNLAIEGALYEDVKIMRFILGETTINDTVEKMLKAYAEQNRDHIDLFKSAEKAIKK